MRSRNDRARATAGDQARASTLRTTPRAPVPRGTTTPLPQRPRPSAGPHDDTPIPSGAAAVPTRSRRGGRSRPAASRAASACARETSLSRDMRDETLSRRRVEHSPPHTEQMFHSTPHSPPSHFLSMPLFADARAGRNDGSVTPSRSAEAGTARRQGVRPGAAPADPAGDRSRPALGRRAPAASSGPCWADRGKSRRAQPCGPTGTMVTSTQRQRAALRGGPC
jgi:hypothetical protein